MASPKSVDKTHLSRKILALDELYQRKLNRSVRHVIETRPPTLKSNRFTSGLGSPTGQTFFGTLETRDGSALERRNGATLVWCRKSCRIVFLFRCIFHLLQVLFLAFLPSLADVRPSSCFSFASSAAASASATATAGWPQVSMQNAAKFQKARMATLK